MAKQVHGGEVKQMVVASGKTHTRESLLKEINDNFGADTIFHSCSADSMNADELISFFEANGKLHLKNGKLEFDVCHDH